MKRMIPLCCLVLALCGCGGTAPKVAEQDAQWLLPLGSYTAIRHSKLNQIDTKNVGKMRVAWTMSTGTLRGQEGQPLVVGNMMYFESSYPNFVYGIDLDNVGKIVWKFAPEQDKFTPSVACCDLVSRGVAYADGKVLVGTLDTHLYALDAKTGNVIWTALNGDPKLGQTMTNAPLVVHDKVIVGISGGEYGVRGHITAYDLNSGKQVWRAYSVGPDQEILFDPNKTMDGATQQAVGKDSSLKTWDKDEWKLGGGTTWGWYSYDPELNLFYYGSGNPSTWNPKQRPGDNRWSMTIWARDVDTGQARWVYQMTPHDEWDFDGVHEMILADGVNVKGKPRNVVVHFDRNGFGYTLDRVTGQLLVAEKFDPKVNWATQVDMKTGRPQVVKQYSTQAQGQDVNSKGICPAALGTKDQQPAAYNPANKMFYVPTNHVCMDYEPFKVEYTAGQPYVGATLSMFPAPGSHGGMGNFIMWDAGTGKIVKSKAEKFSVWSGALVTAGDVACYGTLEGYLKCVDANDISKELYKFKTPSGIGGWAGIGLAAGLEKDTDGLGAVGGYKELKNYTELGGVLTVFSLP